MVALLQPAPEVYALFDDILLLAEGHIVYFGPKEEVRP
jgi:ABC-type multidrug transport system ATPase subunit